MDIIVELCGREGARVEGDRMDLVLNDYGEDGSQSVIGGVSFHNDLSIGVPLNEDRSGGERGLQGVKGSLALVCPCPLCGLSGKTSERNGYVGVMRNESTIEVSKPQEGLYILNLARSWPIQDGLYLVRGHPKSFRRKDEPKIFYRVVVEFALVWSGVRSVLSESSEYFLDLTAVRVQVLGEYEDVVEVDNDTVVE